MSLPDLEHLQTAALQQPGAVRRHAGIKFQCPQCAAEGHDEHLDNACLFNDGRWGCAWATDIEAGRAHRRAIGQVLGAVTNGRVRAETAPPAASAGEDLGLMSIGELLGESDTAPAWLVDQRLPAGGLGILPGKPKAGKTTLARCLALRVARGEPWLGHATTRGPVIYLALEEKRSEVRGHFKALGATSAEPIFILCATAPIDALARLRREAERRCPALIIVDTLFKLIRIDDGNDYALVTAALEPLLTLARETGAHVLAVHHLGKGERGDGDAILGSTAIFASVDTVLLLKRSARYRTLSSIQRYGDDLEEITLRLDPVTRDVTAGPPRDEADLAEASRLIIEALTAAAGPMTEAELDAAVECRTGLRREALRRLVGTEIVRIGRGGKTGPVLYSC